MTSPLSVQLYSVRDAMASDLPGTLRRIADLGFQQVEPYAFADRAAEYTAALQAAGLTAPSTHTSLIGADLDGLFAAAKAAGIDTVIDPHIDESRWGTREDIEAIAAELNGIAAQAADHGLRVGYHNHAFELRIRIDGGSALEVLAAALDPRVVLEVDTYWAEVGGEPAPALLERLGDRVQFLHIKDGPITQSDVDQVPAGQGRMPIREILAAAPQALPVIEFDGYAGDVFEGIAESRRYLTEEA